MPQKDIQKATRADRVLPANVKTIHAQGVAVDGKETSWRIDGYSGVVVRAFPNGTRTWSLRYQMGNGRRALRDKRFPLHDQRKFIGTFLGDEGIEDSVIGCVSAAARLHLETPLSLIEADLPQ
jgi:hypothetical protein